MQNSTEGQDFKAEVYELVNSIPKGKVMTYGQIAALAGNPRAARIVGQIAHFGPPELPWHRVVKKDGTLAAGFPGGMQAQAKLLKEDLTEVKDNRVVNISTVTWWPND